MALPASDLAGIPEDLVGAHERRQIILQQSLLALFEETPERALLARQQALMLARQSGVITARPRTCKPCPVDADVRAYVACLAERLKCLQSP